LASDVPEGVAGSVEGSEGSDVEGSGEGSVEGSDVSVVVSLSVAAEVVVATQATKQSLLWPSAQVEGWVSQVTSL